MVQVSIRKRTRPADPNQLAHNVFLESIGEQPKTEAPDGDARGRAGGLKGGSARAKKLTPEERTDIARTAAAVRWKKIR